MVAAVREAAVATVSEATVGSRRTCTEKMSSRPEVGSGSSGRAKAVPTWAKGWFRESQ